MVTDTVEVVEAHVLYSHENSLEPLAHLIQTSTGRNHLIRTYRVSARRNLIVGLKKYLVGALLGTTVSCNKVPCLFYRGQGDLQMSPPRKSNIKTY